MGPVLRDLTVLILVVVVIIVIIIIIVAVDIVVDAVFLYRSSYHYSFRRWPKYLAAFLVDFPVLARIRLYLSMGTRSMPFKFHLSPAALIVKPMEVLAVIH